MPYDSYGILIIYVIQNILFPIPVVLGSLNELVIELLGENLISLNCSKTDPYIRSCRR